MAKAKTKAKSKWDRDLDSVPMPDTQAQAHGVALDPAGAIYAHPACYGVAMMPSLTIARHVAIIMQHLVAVDRGEITRLIIEAPPRHTKTLSVSTVFPAWYLARHPERQVILATYSQERANDLGRALRDMLQEPLHKALFPLATLRRDQSGVKSLGVKGGGKAHSVGIGGPTTGRGAHVFVVDDPFKDRLQADSPVMRKRVVEWFSSVVASRLQKGGSVIVMATRWHEDDLSGWLLANQADQGWTRLRLPAICEDDGDPLGRAKGDALWPENFDAQTLERMRGIMLPRDWSALYQQRPVAIEGGRFKREWFGRHDAGAVPANLKRYAFVDWAVTPDDGDFTQVGIWGIDRDGMAYALDWTGGQWDPADGITRFLDICKKHNIRVAFMASGVIRRAIGPALRKAMKERQQFISIEYLHEAGDKETRSLSFAARASGGMVSFPKGPRWAGEVIDELAVFPGGKHDDSVDVCSLLGLAIDRMIAAAIKTAPKAGPAAYSFDWVASGAGDEEKQERTF